MGNFQPGRILWAIAPGGRGEAKLRPMIVTSTWQEAREQRVAVVVCCSTDFRRPLAVSEVELPSSEDGRVITKLRRPTVAVCDWIETIGVDACGPDSISGIVPSAIYQEICRRAGILRKTGR